jgi:hypothetical protein
VLVVPAVDLAGALEARMSGVDQLGQLGLARPCRHRQRRDRHPVPDPDAGVAREQQVGQRVDQEVVMGEQGGDQPEAAAHLVVADAGGEIAGELLRWCFLEDPRQVAAHRVAEVEPAECCRDRVVAGLVLMQGLGQQVGQVEHLDVARPQRLGERVVLLLGAVDPGDPVEEELVVVARGEAFQLVAGPVQHDRPQPADLTVRAVLLRPALRPRPWHLRLHGNKL